MTTQLSQLTSARKFISGASSRELKAAAVQYGVPARNPETRKVWKADGLRAAILAVIDAQLAELSQQVAAAPKLDRIQRAQSMLSMAGEGLSQAEIGERLKISAKQVSREINTAKLYQRTGIRDLIDSGLASWQQLYRLAAFSKKNTDEFFIAKLAG